MEDNKSNYISRNDTALIKGIALIFMFIHHFFTYPSWYIEGIRYPSLTKFVEIFRYPFDCVSLFCFVTGYTYFYTKNKNWKYSLKKITDLLIPYWFIYIIFLVIAVYTKNYTFTVQGFIVELFALKRPVMRFCWYVVFYIISMAILPILTKHLNKGFAKALIYGIIVPVIIITALQAISYEHAEWLLNENIELSDLFYNLNRYFPSTIIGYIFAKYSLFYKLDHNIKGESKNKMFYFVCLVLILIGSFLGKYYFPRVTLGQIQFIDQMYDFRFSLDIVYTPLFIYAVVNIAKFVNRYILKIFESIGKRSLLMWFIHCIFFNCCQDIFMPILYMPKNAILVLLWGLLISFIAAVVVEIPINQIVKLKNKYLFKD